MDSLKLKDFLIICIRVISVVIIISLCFVLYNWNKENDDNKRIEKDLLDNTNIITDVILRKEEKEIDSFKIDSEELIKKNSQTVGWIKVNNTDVNYPIVKHTDNEYYLTHNFENSYNSAGWIFMDYRNNHTDLDKNTIIYGHNRRDNSMFGTLKNTLEQSWCENEQNHYITFNTINKPNLAKIFSIYKTSAKDLSIPIDFESAERYKEYLEEITSKSYYNFNTDVSIKDKIITLYTCDDDTTYRIIIHAKIL